MMKTNNCKPFLKWPGGKTWLVPFLSENFRLALSQTYFEPFLGGGAIYFSLLPEQAVLSDINSRLIECFETVRDNPEKVIQVILLWPNSRECYYKVLKMKPKTKIRRAAQLIYLTKSSWGGLYRINKKGEFNVPFGNSGRKICHANSLRRGAGALKDTILMSCDFESIIERASFGDVVYADPPYTLLSQNNGFRRYNNCLFGWEDQQRLAKVCKKVAKRGAFVAVSGLWHPDILSLYKKWWAVRVRRISTVSRKVSSRREINEVVIFSSKPKSFESKWCQKNIESIEISN